MGLALDIGRRRWALRLGDVGPVLAWHEEEADAPELEGLARVELDLKDGRFAAALIAPEASLADPASDSAGRHLLHGELPFGILDALVKLGSSLRVWVGVAEAPEGQAGAPFTPVYSIILFIVYSITYYILYTTYFASCPVPPQASAAVDWLVCACGRSITSSDIITLLHYVVLCYVMLQFIIS